MAIRLTILWHIFQKPFQCVKFFERTGGDAGPENHELPFEKTPVLLAF
jgi:hypothetical protein